MFISRVSIILSPLRPQLCKSGRCPTCPHQERGGFRLDWSAFEELKALLTSSPILAYPDFKKPFVLETDASIAGLGAVLSQAQGDGSARPIAYASRSLLKHERNYGITEMVGLGVVWGVKHFRPYLYGHACEVYTDHEALKSLLNTPKPSGKLTRWGMAIQELNLSIKHRSGSTNANADALSQSPLPSSEGDPDNSPERVVAAVEAEGGNLPMLQKQDPELSPVFPYLETGILPPDDYYYYYYYYLSFSAAVTMSTKRQDIGDTLIYCI